MITAGWPKPEVFSAALTAEGVDWEGRREAQDAYEDTLNAVAFEATHPHKGRFNVPDVAVVAPCAARNVGLALYLLDFTDERAAGIAADPRGV